MKKKGQMELNTGAGGKKRALITGASGGIGLEFARVFAREGYDLALVARTKDTLKKMKQELESAGGVSVHVIAKDLAVPGAAEEIRKELEKKSIAVDALVNNAGFSAYGWFHEIDIETQLEMIQVNFASLVHLTWLFARGMAERGRGEILNVASTAGFMPGRK